MQIKRSAQWGKVQKKEMFLQVGGRGGWPGLQNIYIKFKTKSLLLFYPFLYFVNTKISQDYFERSLQPF